MYVYLSITFWNNPYFFTLLIMWWAIWYDNNWKRDIWYWVPAYCDYPGCKTKIDRGLWYLCGSEDHWCGLYFCSKHLYYHNFKKTVLQVCKRCDTYKPPYKRPKIDHPEWIRWKLKDKSWKEWRKNNPAKVKEYEEILSKNKFPCSKPQP